MKKGSIYLFTLTILLGIIALLVFFLKPITQKNINKVTSMEAVDLAKKELVKRKFEISKKFVSVSEYIPNISRDRQTKDNWIIFFSDYKDSDVDLGLVWVIVDRYNGNIVDVVVND